MAKEAEKTGQEDRGQGKVRSRSNLKIVIILFTLIVVIFFLSGSVFVAFRIGFVDRVLNNMAMNASPQTTEKEPAYTYEVPEILVNLSGADRRRFLSVKFYVGFDESKLAEELERRMPEIRDAILEILWNISAEDVYSPEGKEYLRDEFKKSINEIVNSGEVKDIYFWHIMVQ